MAQFARPSSDISSGSWSANGGPSTLYECIDETTWSSSDYIASSTSSTDTCEVALSSVTDPADHTNHTVRVRLAYLTAASSVDVTLRQGATLIATVFSGIPTKTSYTEYTYTLTSGEAANITNYGDLRLRFAKTAGFGTTNCAWAELEVPDVSSHDLTASDIATSAPSFDSPTLTHTHALTATEVATSYPTVDQPTASQTHTLTAGDIASGAPTFDAPTVSISHDLNASDIATSPPIVDAPDIGQTHGITADDVATGGPTVDQSDLGQSHGLTASEIATGAPALDQPTVSGAHGLTASDIITGTPTLDQPVLGQTHALTAADIITGAPAVDQPTLGQTHALTAADIITGAPAVDQPTVSTTHGLSTVDIATGGPVLDAPSLSQTHAMVADGIATATPVLDSPSIQQTHILTAVDIATDAPVFDLPSLNPPSVHQEELVKHRYIFERKYHGGGIPTVGTPVANFIWTQPDLAVPLVQFTFTGSGATMFLWGFNGEGSSVERDPSFTFMVPAGETLEKTVSLEIDGGVTVVKVITVSSAVLTFETLTWDQFETLTWDQFETLIWS